MRSSAARSWDYDDEVEFYQKPAHRIKLVDPYPAPEEEEDFFFEDFGGMPTRNFTESFHKPKGGIDKDFGYKFGYSKALHTSFKPSNSFEVVTAALSLIPVKAVQRVVTAAGALLLGWFIFNVAFSHIFQPVEKSSAVSIYSFGNTSSSEPLNNSAPVGHTVLGTPSINPTKIDAVLRQYNSPAIGSGQAIYDMGVKYGIDPAYALAFFIHESSAGTQGVAALTKSIGNIRCTSGYECYQTSGNGSFRRYSSWQAGAEDWFKLIKDLYVNGWGLKTLEQIIPRYAPSADHNNPDTYIRQVAHLVDGWRN